MNLLKNLKARIKKREPLRRHTSFRIGGPAQFYVVARDLYDLRRILGWAKEKNITVRIIGAGSNILASDAGLKGLVINIQSDFFCGIEPSGTRVKVGAGCQLSKLVRFLIERGLSGAEFLAGIPGTVGGALAMNAGITQGAKDTRIKAGNPAKKIKRLSIADLVESLTVMDYNGSTKKLGKKSIRFGYRSSGLENYIILSATLRLRRAAAKRLSQAVKDHLRIRAARLDYSFPSAGCIFKNPESDSAGRLIDLCGFKGRTIGGAAVSKKHANFILNINNARAKDVLKLIGIIRAKVKKKFGVVLEPEIRIWDRQDTKG